MGSENRADQAWDFLSNWFTSGFLRVAASLPAVPGRLWIRGAGCAILGKHGPATALIVFQAAAAGGATGAILGIWVILSMLPGARSRRFVDIQARTP